MRVFKWLLASMIEAEVTMVRRWVYCTLVATQTMENRRLIVSVLRVTGGPVCYPLTTNQLGPALAELGADGWEMCGVYSVNFSDGTGQQFYFKRPLD